MSVSYIFNSENFLLLVIFILITAFFYKKVKLFVKTSLEKKIHLINKEILEQEQLIQDLLVIQKQLEEKFSNIDQEIIEIRKEIYEATDKKINDEKDKMMKSIMQKEIQNQENIKKLFHTKAKEIVEKIFEISKQEIQNHVQCKINKNLLNEQDSKKNDDYVN